MHAHLFLVTSRHSCIYLVLDVRDQPQIGVRLSRPRYHLLPLRLRDRFRPFPLQNTQLPELNGRPLLSAYFFVSLHRQDASDDLVLQRWFAKNKSELPPSLDVTYIDQPFDLQLYIDRKAELGEECCWRFLTEEEWQVSALFSFYCTMPLTASYLLLL